MTAVTAGAVYFAVVFGAGFALGIVRVMILNPLIGTGPALAIELPAMLALAWFVCGAVIRRFEVPAAFGARVTMGFVAFSLLMVAEAAVGVVLMGRTLASHLAAYGEASSLVGLAAQVFHATFPLLWLRREAQERSSQVH